MTSKKGKGKKGPKKLKEKLEIEKEVEEGKEAEIERIAATMDINDFKDILLQPSTVKLSVPTLITHWPSVREFVRYDAIRYPKLIVHENQPNPVPTLEVYNIQDKLLAEIELGWKTREEINQLMKDYHLLPPGTLDSPRIESRPSMEFLFDPVDVD